jgi:hypothetical protein
MKPQFSCFRCRGPYKGGLGEDDLKLCTSCLKIASEQRVRSRALGSVSRKLGDAYRRCK